MPNAALLRLVVPLSLFVWKVRVDTVHRNTVFSKKKYKPLAFHAL